MMKVWEPQMLLPAVSTECQPRCFLSKLFNLPSPPFCSHPMTSTSHWLSYVDIKENISRIWLLLSSLEKPFNHPRWSSSIPCSPFMRNSTSHQPFPALCLWNPSCKLLQLVTRKASLASSLTWRVTVIHLPSECNPLMYHFQNLSNSTGTALKCHSLSPTVSVPFCVLGPSMKDSGLGQEVSYQIPKLPEMCSLVQ